MSEIVGSSSGARPKTAEGTTSGNDARTLLQHQKYKTNQYLRSTKAAAENKKEEPVPPKAAQRSSITKARQREPVATTFAYQQADGAKPDARFQVQKPSIESTDPPQVIPEIAWSEIQPWEADAKAQLNAKAQLAGLQAHRTLPSITPWQAHSAATVSGNQDGLTHVTTPLRQWPSPPDRQCVMSRNGNQQPLSIQQRSVAPSREAKTELPGPQAEHRSLWRVDRPDRTTGDTAKQRSIESAGAELLILPSEDNSTKDVIPDWPVRAQAPSSASLQRIARQRHAAAMELSHDELEQHFQRVLVTEPDPRRLAMVQPSDERSFGSLPSAAVPGAKGFGVDVQPLRGFSLPQAEWLLSEKPVSTPVIAVGETKAPSAVEEAKPQTPFVLRHLVLPSSTSVWVGVPERIEAFPSAEPVPAAQQVEFTSEGDALPAGPAQRQRFISGQLQLARPPRQPRTGDPAIKASEPVSQPRQPCPLSPEPDQPDSEAPRTFALGEKSANAQPAALEKPRLFGHRPPVVVASAQSLVIAPFAGNTTNPDEAPSMARIAPDNQWIGMPDWRENQLETPSITRMSSIALDGQEASPSESVLKNLTELVAGMQPKGQASGGSIARVAVPTISSAAERLSGFSQAALTRTPMTTKDYERQFRTEKDATALPALINDCFLPVREESRRNADTFSPSTMLEANTEFEMPVAQPVHMIAVPPARLQPKAQRAAECAPHPEGNMTPVRGERMPTRTLGYGDQDTLPVDAREPSSPVNAMPIPQRMQLTVRFYQLQSMPVATLPLIGTVEMRRNSTLAFRAAATIPTLAQPERRSDGMGLPCVSSIRQAEWHPDPRQSTTDHSASSTIVDRVPAGEMRCFVSHAVVAPFTPSLQKPLQAIIFRSDALTKQGLVATDRWLPFDSGSTAPKIDVRLTGFCSGEERNPSTSTYAMSPGARAIVEALVWSHQPRPIRQERTHHSARPTHMGVGNAERAPLEVEIVSHSVVLKAEKSTGSEVSAVAQSPRPFLSDAHLRLQRPAPAPPLIGMPGSVKSAPSLAAFGATAGTHVKREPPTRRRDSQRLVLSISSPVLSAKQSTLQIDRDAESRVFQANGKLGECRPLNLPNLRAMPFLNLGGAFAAQCVYGAQPAANPLQSGRQWIGIPRQQDVWSSAKYAPRTLEALPQIAPRASDGGTRMRGKDAPQGADFGNVTLAHMPTAPQLRPNLSGASVARLDQPVPLSCNSTSMRQSNPPVSTVRFTGMPDEPALHRLPQAIALNSLPKPSQRAIANPFATSFQSAIAMQPMFAAPRHPIEVGRRPLLLQAAGGYAQLDPLLGALASDRTTILATLNVSRSPQPTRMRNVDDIGSRGLAMSSGTLDTSLLSQDRFNRLFDRMRQDYASQSGGFPEPVADIEPERAVHHI